MTAASTCKARGALSMMKSCPKLARKIALNMSQKVLNRAVFRVSLLWTADIACTGAILFPLM